MKQDVKEIYLDNHLLVLSKPGGLLTQPSALQENSLELVGKELLKKRFHKPGNVFLEAIHRLDKGASGLVLFARTSKVLPRLKQALSGEKFSKEYLAVVHGEVFPQEGELQHFLVHADFHAKVYNKAKDGAKFCRLRYHVIKCAQGHSLLHIRLFTGRYHQIRAQLSSIGHPIVGDSKYGSSSQTDAILLHHFRLKAPHPVTGETLCWEAPFFDNWPSQFSVSP